MAELTPEEKADLKERICDILEVDAEEVTETSLFKDDHGADSMLAIEILAMLERQCSVEIAQASMARMVNLEGVYAVVNQARAQL
ncbi:acyl carrier protein [Propionibacterium sp. oral taxon 192 str. F0372]|uniref:acyl carrier protein n=1 Tax=Propionibacterium sp. oral taxon 192 TaxID=671222 RepID=UPI00035452D1|nr:acyl carrier protein [Propionibacterium sp. oral taxon 192]EPH05563.1 acyl carrier protein [Propionibacterium sp. oral taxon 192 str. F0372]